MQDVVMNWKGGGKQAVYGVANVEIPQFTIVDYRCISTVEELATGEYAHCACAHPSSMVPLAMLCKHVHVQVVELFCSF